MLRAWFSGIVGEPWTQVPNVAVGAVGHSQVVSVFVTVERDGEPLLRIDVYEQEPAHRAFQEAMVWHELAVVGFGGHVHLVTLQPRNIASYALDGYFGHLYPLDERLLVADAEGLHCFAPTGRRLWQSDQLGIDGVVVHDVDGDAIEGEGEWDPPGGWRPFRISLASGMGVAR